MAEGDGRRGDDDGDGDDGEGEIRVQTVVDEDQERRRRRRRRSKRIANLVPEEDRCGEIYCTHHIKKEYPTNNALLMNFLLSNACAMCTYIPTELPLCLAPLVVG